MCLTSITYKNIKYNIKNFIAYFLGISFVICNLFMFLNLLCSKAFMNSPSTSLVKSDLLQMLVMMAAFSVVFISYTTVSFTKYRGKEFGVYFTIGLTSKNIIKILFYENIIISAAAFILGTVWGTIFSKLFYMAVIKILQLDNINIELSIKAYGLIAIVAIFIFISNTLYQVIFLKKVSIVDILKANSKRKASKLNSVLGIIAVISCKRWNKHRHVN